MLIKKVAKAFKQFKHTVSTQLRLQLTLLVLGLFSIIFILFAAGILLILFRTEQNVWANRLKNAAQSTAHIVEDSIGEIQGFVNFVDAMGADMLEENPVIFGDYISQIPYILEAAYYDQNDNLITRTMSENNVLVNRRLAVSSRWFKAAKAGDIYWSNVFYTSEEGVFFVVGFPLQDGGVLAMRVKMYDLQHDLSEVQLGTGYQVYLIDEYGTLMAHSDADSMPDGTFLGNREEIQLLLAEEDKSLLGRYINPGGEMVVSAAYPIAGTGWVVIVEQLQREAFHSLYNAMIFTIFAFITSVVLIYYISSYILTRTVFEPADQIKNGIEILREGILDHQIHVKKQNEFSLVAAAINQLSADLEVRNAQLAEEKSALTREIFQRKNTERLLVSLNEDLENRVKKRTAALEEINEQLQSEVEERKKIEQALRISQERYLLALQGANDGIWDWSLKDHQIYFSERWKAMLGYRTDEIGSDVDEWFSRIHPDDYGEAQQKLSRHLAGETELFEAQFRMMHRDQGFLWFNVRGVAVRDEDGLPYRMAGSISDINQQKQDQDQLLYDASHDELTGLFNRAEIQKQIDFAIQRANRRPDFHFSVLFLDFDHFKLVNDSYGHSLGDELLKEIAGRLIRSVRIVDAVARLGGDEFVILLQDVTEQSDIHEVVERLLQNLNAPYKIRGMEIFLSASIGVVSQISGYENSGEILRDADIAMYRAKADGRARYEIFSDDLRRETIERLTLERDMRQALKDEAFHLVYQPIFDIHSGKMTGFEALLRWEHSEIGFISPARFIPVAEESGLILPLGNWVMESVCKQIRFWNEQNVIPMPYRVSINISGVQLKQPVFRKQVIQLLNRNKDINRYLSFEITESTIMESSSVVYDLLNQIKDRGIGVLIDDFGTGYSSLQYLQNLPVEGLKIDYRFISEIEDNQRQFEIVKAMLVLSQQLGLHSVAEGIETEAQLEILKSMGCDEAQGYYFSKPLSVEDAAKFAARQIAPDS